ncbi:MAG: hypothetical protein O6952_00165, partial [Planctomycetota bacterium]|nr:hypothetical protein [Planctomycetota bacterium]
MKLSYLLAAVALCLLWPLGTAGAQGLLTSDLWQQGSAPGGYKPLDPPDPDVTARRRSRPIRVRGKPGELPLDHLHIRAWYRTTALTASKIAKSRGVWVGEAPRQNDALNPSIGFGADFVYSFTPLMSLTYSIGYEWFEGGRAAGADFHDFGYFLTSVGPRINFPLGLSPGDWSNPEAVPYVRGIIPYVRLGLGLALTSDIDYDEPGTG